MKIVHKTNLTRYLPDILFQISVVVLAYKVFYTTCTGTGLYMVEKCIRHELEDWGKILAVILISMLLNIAVRTYLKQQAKQK